MPHSFDPYIGFGFRIFVDFLFTQSLSRLALVALWSLVGMLIADITPNVWRDSGLRHLYRQVRKDVRHVKRSVPRIRIENDLPSVRLFQRSRSTSTEVSGSIRSDRAAPSRSPIPSPALAPSPARRPGRSPPGTFPDVSGWSETATDVSRLSLLRERVVTNPASPALISSREFAAGERIDAIHTHVTTLETQTTTVHDTTTTITQTQQESVQSETVVEATTIRAAALSRVVESEDSSRHEPPTIPDDWVDIDYPTPIQADEPVPPLQPDSESAPEREPTPPTPTPPRPASVLIPPPAIDILPDIPNVDVDDKVQRPLDQIPLLESRAASGLRSMTESRSASHVRSHVGKASRPPDEIPLPESRAASVLGSVVDQPEPRSASRARSRVEKASRPPDEVPLPESRAVSVLGSVVDQPQPRSASHARSQVGKASRPPDEVPLPESRAASVLGSVVDQPEPRSASRARSQVGKASRLPDEIPLPESRAASVLGSVVDQPESRSALHTRSRVEKVSRPPDEVPLPESRAASVLGTIIDQPEPRGASRTYSRVDKAASEVGGTLDQSQPRSALRENLRSGVEKAASEIGVDRATYIASQSSKTQTTSRSWTEFASWGRSKLKQAVDVNASLPPPKEPREEKSEVGITAQSSEPPLSTPAQVDPPVNILTQPGDAPPLLLTTEIPKPEDQDGQPLTSKPELTPIFSAGVDTSPTPLQGEANKGEADKGKADKGDVPRPIRKDSLFDLPDPTRTPPPPFTEFAGVPEGPAAGEAPAAEDPLVQDEGETELTEEQKVAEEKRRAFLTTQVSQLEKSRTDLQKKLEDDDPMGTEAKALESDIEDAGKTLNSVKTRMSKKKFSEPQSPPSLPKVVLLQDKTATEAEIALTSAILDMLLTRDDAGPITIQAVINRSKPLKGQAKEAKEAVSAFVKRHKFTQKFENKTPGVINITF